MKKKRQTFKDLLAKYKIEPPRTFSGKVTGLDLFRILKFSCEELERFIQKHHLDNPTSQIATLVSLEFWQVICWYQKLEDWFIEKYKDHIDWETLWSFHKLTPEFVLKYLPYIDRSITENSYYKRLPSSVRLIVEQKLKEKGEII